ncbi:MAG: hypothetical protein K9M98_05220 [Cephaloticoccus sp.]|nr:hypothetical protein [Cephaloticoccus sp.]MCF7759883.1 hypothetical protein [Cephaloticoccus sp.]
MLLLDAAQTDQDIIAVGERGTILRSRDNGQKWDAIAAPTLATLTAVTFARDGQHGWAVGHDASVLATVDGGLSWTVAHQGPNLEVSYLDVCAADENTIIVIGAYGLGLRSLDAGKSWQPLVVQDSDSHLNCITRGNNGTLYIAGERGTLLRSKDRGETWENIASPYDGSFYGILPLSDTELLAYGLRGHIYQSLDDGDNWTSVPIATHPLLAAACVLGPKNIVLAGQARAFLISRDGGSTFTPWAQTQTTGVAQLLLTTEGRLLAFGESGVTFLQEP